MTTSASLESQNQIELVSHHDAIIEFVSVNQYAQQMNALTLLREGYNATPAVIELLFYNVTPVGIECSDFAYK